jgi:hypothetical protein
MEETPLNKVQTKSYIDGLMVAGRIFGISFDELQQLLAQEQSNINDHVTKSAQAERNNAEDLDIPTFIRKHKTITQALP